MESSRYQWLRLVGQCSFIPIYLALYPVAFFYLGTWLDNQLGTRWIKGIFLILGMISAFRQTYFLIRNLLQNLDKDRGP